MEWLITYPQVCKALNLAKNGTATGLDSCPYELWKELDKRYSDTKSEGREGFDVVGALTTVFNNIQIFGMDKETRFAEGWMCPIYKKKDPTEIGNYRPITVTISDLALFNFFSFYDTTWLLRCRVTRPVFSFLFLITGR